jgi:hypothetical protein
MRVPASAKCPINEDLKVDALPGRIQQRVEALQRDIDTILERATSAITTSFVGPAAFHYVNLAPRDVLTPYELAQSRSFVVRYQHLPREPVVEIVECNGEYHVANVDFLRHVLND